MDPAVETSLRHSDCKVREAWWQGEEHRRLIKPANYRSFCEFLHNDDASVTLPLG
jgi:hypothetical protein